MKDLVRRVRLIDPAANENAVERYAREIAEAESVVNSLDSIEMPMTSSFSPAWTGEGES